MVMDVSEAAQDEGENVSVTLMELGSQWPDRLDVIPSTTFENIVMAQDAAESPEAFASRATRRLEDVRASGHRLRSAILLVGGAFGKGSPVVRSRLGMIVGGFLPKGGSLTFVGDDHLSADERADLASVAASLSEYFGPEGPGVRLQLELRHERARGNAN